MENELGRQVPENAGSYRELQPFSGSWDEDIVQKNDKLASLEEVLDNLDIKDGMTISFHHHFREGDLLINMIIDKLAEMGIKDLTLASSSLANVHSHIIKHIKNNVITKIQTSGLRGELGEEISRGLMDDPVIIRSHGGRAGAIETGRLEIDVAFLAAPSADRAGNISGSRGKSTCGSLGYARVDARNADRVVAFTDNLVEFPAKNISIPQRLVDYVVEVDKIGNPEDIASGALRKPTNMNPKNMIIAEKVAQIISSSSCFKGNFSMQTGSGTISLATIDILKDRMKEKNVKGSFMMGGITGGHVDLLEEGYFDVIYDTQTFDMAAIESIRKNENHLEIDAADYANPFNKAPLVNDLDFMILSALEIDLDYNVNVITGSDGVFRGASGGHSDTAAGSEISIVVAPAIRGRIPTIKDKVNTVITPGEDIDILVTERGVCVNPKREDLRRDIEENTTIKPINIEKLKNRVEKLTGKPGSIEYKDNIVGLIEYRDGSIIDVVREVK
ncbi:MAG: citrate lyase subunit alpha [Halanaerobiaceae bacterium]